jgi:putative DNA primase/helicase
MENKIMEGATQCEIIEPGVNNVEVGPTDEILAMQSQVQTIIQAETEEYNIQAKPADKIASSDIMEALKRGEDGDSDLFVFFNKDKLIYDHSSTEWYLWKDERWNLDKKEQRLVSFESLINIYAQEINNQTAIQITAIKAEDSNAERKSKNIIKDLSNRIKKLHTVNRKKNILKLASSGENSLGIIGDEWDKHNNLLACANGVIDLKTGVFRKNTPQDYFKSIAPVKFESLDTPAPAFVKFLRGSLNNNQKLIDFIQRLFGSAISGSVIEHRIPVFWGENGRNGKGTLIEVNKKVLGNLASPIPAEMLLKQANSRSSAGASPDIILLKGKRLVWASETEEGRQIDVSKIKWLSGGDTLVGRGVWDKYFSEFDPTHSLFILTNHRPHIPAGENAIWQRIFLIPFEISFVDDPKKSYERKRDPHLKEKLLKEKSGILSWLIRGHIAWQREGLNPPDIVIQHTHQYKEDENSIKVFIKERCIEDINGEIYFKDLFAEYKNWCVDNDLKPETQRKLGTYLTRKFDKLNKGTIVYKGISLQKYN